MLILNTPKGDIPIAKGNIHTIHADYNEGFIYVTEDFVGYPFRSINGIKVKDQIPALQLVNEFADENGETAIDFPVSEEMTKAYEDYLKKLDEKVIETEPVSSEDYQAMIDKGQIKINKRNNKNEIG